MNNKMPEFADTAPLDIALRHMAAHDRELAVSVMTTLACASKQHKAKMDAHRAWEERALSAGRVRRESDDGLAYRAHAMRVRAAVIWRTDGLFDPWSPDAAEVRNALFYFGFQGSEAGLWALVRHCVSRGARPAAVAAQGKALWTAFRGSREDTLRVAVELALAPSAAAAAAEGASEDEAAKRRRAWYESANRPRLPAPEDVSGVISRSGGSVEDKRVRDAAKEARRRASPEALKAWRRGCVRAVTRELDELQRARSIRPRRFGSQGGCADIARCLAVLAALGV